MSATCANALDTMRQALYPMFMGRYFSFLAAVILLAFFLTGCAGKSKGNTARNVASAQEIVDSATDILRGYMEGEQKTTVSELIAQAKGIMIIPGMGNVSFFFSLGGGNALMMARAPGGWSGPVFLSKGTGGLGAQVGVTRTSGIILYMAEEDVRYVLETGAVLQGRAAITFLDADFEGNRTPEFAEAGEVVFIGDTSGLYAGVGISGGGLSDRESLNAAYHGVENGDPQNILFKTATMPEGAQHLRDLLDMADTVVDTATKKDGTFVPSI